MRQITALLLAIGLVGCVKDSAPKKAAVETNAPVLKIAVFSDGRLTVDGASSSIEMLRASLHRLAEAHGVVWYYREAGKEEPPEIATEVINEVIQARVPIRLSSKPDYSDSATSP